MIILIVVFLLVVSFSLAFAKSAFEDQSLKSLCAHIWTGLLALVIAIYFVAIFLFSKEVIEISDVRNVEVRDGVAFVSFLREDINLNKELGLNNLQEGQEILCEQGHTEGLGFLLEKFQRFSLKE